MITLEETLLKMSGGKLQLSKFGMHSKDFSKLEGKIAPEFLIKEKELEEIENDFQIYHKLENTTFTAYFVPKIKMWYEEEIVNLLILFYRQKTKFERPQFEKLIKQLYLIYQKAPVHHHHKPEVHAAEKANDSPDKKDGENGSPQQEKKETKTSNFNVEFKKTEIFPENSKIVEQELMNFMDFIKIEHKFEMWSGYKYSIVIPEDFRNFLWYIILFEIRNIRSSFTFTNKHFGLNPKREHSIKLNKQGSMSSLSDLDSPMKKSNADAGSLNDAEGNGNIMRAASIGSVDQIEETKEERAQRKKS